MELQHSIGLKWAKYITILLILVLLKHCNMYKTEVAIKLCFAKKLFLLFRVNQGSYLQIQENAQKILLNKLTFNANTLQVFIQGFYLLSHYFYYILDFKEHLLFKTSLFLTPSQWLAQVLHNNRIDENPQFYGYFSHFQGV